MATALALLASTHLLETPVLTGEFKDTHCYCRCTLFFLSIATILLCKPRSAGMGDGRPQHKHSNMWQQQLTCCWTSSAAVTSHTTAWVATTPAYRPQTGHSVLTTWRLLESAQPLRGLAVSQQATQQYCIYM